MTSYRRLRIFGGTYFFTVALAGRGTATLLDRIDDLRAAYAETCRERAVRTEAIVILPDHLHAVWTLPAGDADFSTRWRLIKSRFSRRIGQSGPRSASKRAKGERGLWQRRFWEHCIRTEADLALHLRYCWHDPVRHGLADRAADWPFSSVHRDLRAHLAAPDLSTPGGCCFGEPQARMGEDHPSYDIGALRRQDLARDHPA